MSHVWRLGAACALVFGASLSLLLQPQAAQAAGTISGVAFLDFNQDGVNNLTASASLPAVDQGVAGVQVRVYDAADTQQGSATTGANGSYSLTATGTGPYRVEFTVPAGYQPSGQGADNGTTIQFVANGGGTANLGLTIPSEYCQNNPLECTSRYVNGDAVAGSLIGNTEGIVAFPEASTSGAAAGLITSTLSSNVGATWGLAWQRNSNTLFAAAVAKRYASFGPGGSGAIYKLTIDPTTGVASAVSVFVDMATITGGPGDTGTITGRDLVSDNYGTPSYDADAFAKVGKISLGDIDVSDDGQTLYVMSLTDRKLYSLNIGPNAVAPASVSGVAVTLPVGAPACNAADVRPWAVEVHNGSVYVGAVCSAQTSLDRADLHAYVLRLNGAAFDLVTDLALDYSRACASTDTGCFPAEWQPWRDTASSVCSEIPTACRLAFDKQIIYAQPILSDIEFDRDGSLILGFQDRSAHQWGNQNYGPGSASSSLTVNYINPATGAVSSTGSFGATKLYEGASAGDLLRLCPDGSGGYDLESNASCGGTTTGGAGSNPAQGPGGGEYYWQDMFALGSLNSGTHNEITLGGLKLVPGRTEIGVVAFDPVSAIRAGGIAWFSNTTGQRTHSYQIFGQDVAGSMGKAGGLGDLEALCANAPIEIGNRVWVDTNDDGVQGPDEPALANVTVNLFNGSTQIGTATTDTQGAWYFGGVTNRNLTGGNVLAPNTSYEVRVPLSQTTITSGGYSLTTANAGANDSIDSDATASSGNAVIALTTGGAGANNHTYDIGFNNGLSLGNLVWSDRNNNGSVDPGEPGIDGVPVELVLGASTVATTTTTSGGNYLFGGLAPGNYIVRISPPVGYCSSTGTPGSVTGAYEGTPGSQPPDPDNDVNNDDNGNGVGTCGQGGYAIESAPVTLATSTEPTDDGDSSNNSNLSVDFGLVGVLSLGNLVWFDVNNNGLVDGIEAGIDSVTVRLLDSGGVTITSTTTAGGGLYRFNELAPGDYIVEVVPPSGYCSSTGAPGSITASGPYEGASTPDPDTNVNNDDNGSVSANACGQAGYTLRSAAVTLAYGAEPTNDDDSDPNSNLSVDFGLFRPVGLGNLVWGDSDNSGTVNGGETGINGVTVRLYTAGGALVSSTTTASGGQYAFANLAPGDYYVEVTPPANTCSSTGSANSATGPYEGTPGTQPPDPDSNIDNDDNGYGVGACGQGGYVVRSSTVTLTSGGEPTGDGDGSDSNLTIDFGLTPSVSLGNLVWVDSDNNGLVNGGEIGLNGVTVRLFSGTGTLITSTTTAGGGLYLFSNLSPGDYIVEIAPPAGYCSSTGTPGSASGAYEGNPAGNQPPDPDNDIDNDDNGNAAAGACGQPGHTIRAAVVTLAIGAEPTDDGDGSNSNLSVDFGLVPVLALGDRVWNDANNNGIIDGGESGIDDLQVRLYTSTGTLVATTTTAGGGLYGFGNLTPGDYYVEVTPATGTCSSSGTPGSATGPYEGNPAGNQPPDPDNDVNNDDNGNGVGTCGQPGYVVRSSVITLSLGSEPTNDGDSNANTNLSLDFGLVGTLGLGDLVWVDTNNNGVLDSGESGLNGVTVNLLSSSGTVLTTTTTAGGGLYGFTNLVAGDYIVEIVPPAGYCSSTGTIGSPTGAYEGTPGTQPPDPDNDVNSDDNGNGVGACGQPGYVVRSTAVMLSNAAEPTNDGDGNNSNLSIDFGLVLNLSLGNLVWSDSNNNGLVDGGEAGVDGLTVQLYSGAGSLLASTTTANGGHYLFVNLPGGDYYVVVTPPSGACSSTGVVGSSTGPYEGAPGTQPPDPDSNLDNDDNGYGVGTCGQPGYVVRSSTVSLSAGSEPTTDGDTDSNSNLSVDFGLVGSLSLGDLVWVDADNGGTVNGAEAGLNGVSVYLYSSSGTLMATTTTAGGGLYNFTNLVPGDYYVVIEPPAGYCSSSGSIGSATGPYEGTPGTQPPDPDTDTNNDDNGYGVGTCGSGGYLIRSGVITLTAGGEPTNDGDADSNSNLSLDFGVLQSASLGNFVWNDSNSDGVQGPSELGVGGVTVTLRDGSNNVIATTQTAPDGSYLFPNLTPGTYSVCFNNFPIGSGLTIANGGGNDAADSDADPNTGCTSTYTLTAGQQDLTVDAGLINIPTAATLTSFAISGPAGGKVTVTWTTAEEVNVSVYRVYRSLNGFFASATKVCEKAATGSDSSYSCLDTVPGNGPYTYWLTELTTQGQEHILTSPLTIVRLAIPSLLHR